MYINFGVHVGPKKPCRNSKISTPQHFFENFNLKTFQKFQFENSIAHHVFLKKTYNFVSWQSRIWSYIMHCTVNIPLKKKLMLVILQIKRAKKFLTVSTFTGRTKVQCHPKVGIEFWPRNRRLILQLEELTRPHRSRSQSLSTPQKHSGNMSVENRLK